MGNKIKYTKKNNKKQQRRYCFFGIMMEACSNVVRPGNVKKEAEREPHILRGRVAALP